MSQHQVPVPHELWQKIESALPPVKLVWYRRPPYVAAVAVALIAVIVSVILYLTPSGNVPITPATVTDVEHVACKSTLVADSCGAVTDSAHLIDNVDCNDKLCVGQGNSSSAEGDVGDYQVEGCERSHICKYWSKEVCGNTFGSDSCSRLCNVADTVWLAQAPQDASGQGVEDAVMDDNWETYSPPLLSEVEPMNGSHGDYDLPLRCERPSYDMRISLSASTSGSRLTTIPYTFRGHSGEVSYDHHMPLNVKALFEKRFGKWSIGAGLSYAYLTANYEMTGNIRNGRQDMHYVGIPIYFAYEFARINRFSFYASAGGQIDFNTAGKHIENDDSCLYSCIGTYEFRDEKPQLSAQIHVGAAFDLLDQLALYVEPTLGYYFDNGSCVHTVWSDNPLNFYLTVGLRTSF